MEKEQQELLNAGLGLTTVGIGATFALFPGLTNKLGGFDIEPSAGRNALFRLVGMRDLALGLGLLLNRQEQEKSGIWLNLFALVTGSDILVLGLALLRSKRKLPLVLGMVVSASAMALALRNSRE